MIVIGVDLLKTLADLGGLGVLALFLIIGFFLARSGLALVKDQVIPLVRNHLEHMEESYNKMSENLERHTDVLDSMRMVQEAQAASLESHTELTRELIERLPKNSSVKRLLE